MTEDRHNTARLANWLSYLVGIFFVAIALFGYQRTGDALQLLAFLVLALVGFCVVKLLFSGINRLLDSLDKPSDH
ncbi:hypothetical protein [Aliamphritea ceti]|uniref:hypothetical protein n=1 Tax=Aliamphritea ceti TaxID=1524258 RepID=UPI0021C41D35|nr:hypothetical protein [Aliamphritea ceti]